MRQQTIGERLRKTREARGINVYLAARATRIRPDFLQSMERDAFDFLTGTTYVKGMLRAYASWLGLDAEEMGDEFERIHGSRPGPSLAQILREPAQRPPRSRERVWVMAAAVAASSLLALSLLGVMNPTSTRVATPPAAPNARSNTERAGANPSVAQAPAVAASGVEVTVTIVGEKCWLGVVADGKTIFEKTLRNGAVQTFHANGDLLITFGRLDAVRITVNGADWGAPPPKTGELVGTYIFDQTTTSWRRA